MKNYCYYPFTAVVGQEQVKQALCIALVNPRAGGLLIGGRKGTGKSVLARSLKELAAPRQLLNLPLNITEDMLFGSIDVERALRLGEKHFAPGLLGRANGQLLYVDDINLLRTELLSAILNVQAAGMNRVEREGISYEEPVDFTLIGTMNPEEGTFPNHMLDRFGMYVDAENLTEPEARVEVMRRCLEFGKAPKDFCQAYEAETEALKAKLEKAQELVKGIEPSEAMLILAAQMCAQAFCAGHRAELYLLEAAKAIAALAGRSYVLPKDLEEAAVYVLPHRMRKPPEQQPEQQEPEEQEENNQEESQEDSNDNQEDNSSEEQPNLPPPPSGNQDEEDNSDDQEEEDSDKEDQPQDKPDNSSNLAPEEQVVDIDRNFRLPKMLLDMGKNNNVKRGSGKRSVTRTDLKQGRYVRAEQPRGKVEDLAFDATIRAAAPFQKMREPNGCALNIVSSDMRQKVREKRIGNTFLFAVDASGSMGARERMGAVKGAIFYMLQEAYQKRDRVGMLAFRRDIAELLLPITRSVDLAQRCLSQMPTGGKTPLAEGLAMAYCTLDRMSKADQELEPILILVTDGRANNKSADGSNPVEAALKMAEHIRKAKITSLVIDTEKGFIKLGLAKAIAKAMGANYYTLNSLSQENILHIIRNIGE